MRLHLSHTCDFHSLIDHQSNIIKLSENIRIYIFRNQSMMTTFVSAERPPLFADMNDPLYTCPIYYKKILRHSYIVCCQCCWKRVHRNCTIFSHEEFLLVQNFDDNFQDPTPIFVIPLKLMKKNILFIITRVKLTQKRIISMNFHITKAEIVIAIPTKTFNEYVKRPQKELFQWIFTLIKQK